MEERKHMRVPLAELRENPDKGIYISQNTLKNYGILTGAILFLLMVVSAFNRK